jgi:hypothetical protein
MRIKVTYEKFNAITVVREVNYVITSSVIDKTSDLFSVTFSCTFFFNETIIKLGSSIHISLT